jgi:hypothetical protein
MRNLYDTRHPGCSGLGSLVPWDEAAHPHTGRLEGRESGVAYEERREPRPNRLWAAWGRFFLSEDGGDPMIFERVADHLDHVAWDLGGLGWQRRKMKSPRT